MASQIMEVERKTKQGSRIWAWKVVNVHIIILESFEITSPRGHPHKGPISVHPSL